MMSSRWLACAALLCSPALAAVVVEDFRVGWVRANPDGKLERPVIGVNGAWPVPQITATVGDRLVLNVHNDLGNASTSLHFHGFFQNGTNHRDGAVGVTQCAIPPGESFSYDIEFVQAGTYWYHSHNRGQYMDGLRGAIVVHDPAGPYEGAYDDEIVLSVSDWYHEPLSTLLPAFINVENPTGAEPVPQAALLNDTQNLQVAVQPGKTYLVRLVNIGGFASHYVWFEGHTMRIVEVDGVWTEPAEASMVYITPAQRYSVLITTKNDTRANFAVVAAMDEALFDVIPDDQNSNVTGWLVYDDAQPLPTAAFVADYDDAHDDFALVPVDAQPLLATVDHSLSLDVKMDNLGDGANYAFFNDETYVAPKVPSLYTALTVGSGNNTSPLVYGSHTNAHVLRHNDVVEIVLNNYDDGRHPFHLHGHNFQVVRRSDEDAGPYVPAIDEEFASATADNSNDDDGLPAVPMRRDTVFVEGNGHFVIRFRADNPGVWLFHCHIEWHMDQGLVATFIEAPAELLADPRQAIPANHRAVCKAAGVPAAGNAAGNTEDVFDLKGENAPPKPLPEGFTAKGYVALFFSTVSALLGMAVIAWYGLLDPNAKATDGEHEPLIQDDGESSTSI